MTAGTLPESATDLRAQRDRIRKQLASFEKQYEEARAETERAVADHAAGRIDGKALTSFRATRDNAAEALAHLRPQLEELEQELELAEQRESRAHLTRNLEGVLSDCAAQGRELHSDLAKAAAKLIRSYRKLLERCSTARELGFQLVEMDPLPEHTNTHERRRDVERQVAETAWGKHAGLGLLIVDLMTYMGVEAEGLAERQRLLEWELVQREADLLRTPDHLGPAITDAKRAQIRALLGDLRSTMNELEEE